MAIADTILFWNNKLHSSQLTRVITASSIAQGFAVENVREADLVSAWKPNDSASTTEWLKADGATTGWLGAGPALCFAAIAYDARGSNQNVLTLQTDSVDDGAFGGTLTPQWTHTMDKTALGQAFVAFTCPNKRWFRLTQLGTDRSGGSVTAKIHYWGMYALTDITQLATDFPGDSEAAYGMRPIFRVSREQTVGDVSMLNQYASHGMDFDISLDPVSDAMWQVIRDQLYSIGGPLTALFIQKEGIKNPAQASFALSRMVEQKWTSERRFLGSYHQIKIPFVTEASA